MIAHMTDPYALVTDYCEAFLGSTKEYPFGDSAGVYKVAGKMFALVAEDADPPNISLKLDPAEGEALRAAHPGTVTPGYHLNKKHWNTVVLDGTLTDGEVTSLIRQSYDLVVASLPKHARPATPDHP
jgi:predicted DNA-binding protein (MmcQ/YjbR family)